MPVIETMRPTAFRRRIVGRALSRISIAGRIGIVPASGRAVGAVGSVCGGGADTDRHAAANGCADIGPTPISYAAAANRCSTIGATAPAPVRSAGVHSRATATAAAGATARIGVGGNG
jgi:hypothetical protein